MTRRGAEGAPMRILILGSSGMAGHMLCAYLSENGHDVTGFSRRQCPVRGVHWIRGDASDTALLRGILVAGGYDAVVNCVGVLNRDAEDNPARAALLNAALPHTLAALAPADTLVVQLSTDCVFAGNGGPYSESSHPDGGSFYDRSKALGELSEAEGLTLRQSIVGPDTCPTGIGLLNWFMQQEGSVRGWTGAIWTGLTTLELAKAVEACVRAGDRGLVNMVPDGSGISKCDLLLLFDEHLRGGSVEVVPDGSISLDKTLVRMNRSMHYVPAPYTRQVVELSEWMSQHWRLYPHYRLGGRV